MKAYDLEKEEKRKELKKKKKRRYLSILMIHFQTVHVQ